MNNYSQDNKSRSSSLGKFIKKKPKHSNSYSNEEEDSDFYCYNSSNSSPAKNYQPHQQTTTPIYQYPYEQRIQPNSNLIGLSSGSHTSDSNATLTDSELVLMNNSVNGCMLDKKLLNTLPPDVPPRNNMGTLNRLNGRMQSHHLFNNEVISKTPSEYAENTSCLERTPSGNVYIPAGTLSLAPNFNKNHYQPHSNASLCSSPTKDKTLPYGTPIPVRTTNSSNNIGTMKYSDNPSLQQQHHHLHHHHHNHIPQNYSASSSSSAIPSKFSFSKNVKDKCSWKCTALLSILMLAMTIFMISYNITSVMKEKDNDCPVIVSDNIEHLQAIAEDTFATVPAVSLSSDRKSDFIKGKKSRGKRELEDSTFDDLLTTHDLHEFFSSTTFENYEHTTEESSVVSTISSTDSSIHISTSTYSSATSFSSVSMSRDSGNVFLSTVDSLDHSTTTQSFDGFSDLENDINLVTEISSITTTPNTEKPVTLVSNSEKNNIDLHSFYYETVLAEKQKQYLLSLLPRDTKTDETGDSFSSNFINIQNNSNPMFIMSLFFPIINVNNFALVPREQSQIQTALTQTNPELSPSQLTSSSALSPLKTREKAAKNSIKAPETNTEVGCKCSCPSIDTLNDFCLSNENYVSSTTSMNDNGCGLISGQSLPPEGIPFELVAFDKKLIKSIQPFSYWNMQFSQTNSAYIRFDITVVRGAKFGLYAKLNELPTHTQYDIFDILSGIKVKNSRTSMSTVRKQTIHYMEKGNWFLSLYNDGIEDQQVEITISISEELTQQCPNGCSGKGECLMGQCQCNPGFGGYDCNDSVCPVLCNNRGNYLNGECQCNSGWKGKECQLKKDECEVSDCNGHGHCLNGKCICSSGYKGVNCSEIDCPKPNCSGHGSCIEGVCHCKKGWKGFDCSETDQEALQCLPNCSGHGTFDLNTQKCLCHLKWSGDDCSKEICNLNCGVHGQCVNSRCECSLGWSGDNCNVRKCDDRCNEHGQCKNGTCICVTGWNGKHCSVDGCPNGCTGHGECNLNYADNIWQCRCDMGWKGSDCNTTLEQYCDDGLDDDRDGLIDCEDPECCQSPNCKSSQLCITAPKPIDVLLRKNPPTVTASFFERMKFLIDEDSLQSYAKTEVFNESRTAVIRGQIVTSLGLGLMGVRVSTKNKFEGFTFTRDDGWFDILVNGGGSVTLVFGRVPFGTKSYVVNVPWNEIIIIDRVVMVTKEEKYTSNNEAILRYPVLSAYVCYSHDFDFMRPIVVATWKHGFHGSKSDVSGILAESQVVQETFKIPGTNLNLVYHSSRATGYLSTIQLQLTPEIIPSTLQKIYLKITIEGILFEKTFEADPALKFTYAWNKLNVYRQRVYGMATATIKVGYEYSSCKKIIWNTQTTRLSGHDMSISEIGGWNLDIHHRYNFHEGILQKGDGYNIYFKEKPKTILTTIGDGHQRSLSCDKMCNGRAIKQRLLAPVSLASSADGSLYIGDFNLIRKLSKDGSVNTLVKLNTSKISYRYHLAVSPKDGSLYVSDPEMHQILKVVDVNDFKNPETNFEVVIGSGERCLPGDEAHCGDGLSAIEAKLAYPKGIAVSYDNIMYFSDGTNIRMVNLETNIISTLIGDHMHKSHWKPLPCEGIIKLDEVHLRWPTELAISPLDNSLHIIDDHMILKITVDGRLQIIAGKPLHCNYQQRSSIESNANSFSNIFATRTTLVMPQSFAFDPYGVLYVAESDSQRINRIRKIDTDGTIELFAGASESKCNCLEKNCDCFGAGHFIALNSKLNTISAIAVTPDGVLHISDQANYRIRSVSSSKPELNMNDREFEIYVPESQEVYIFNRFGQHVVTRNLITGKDIYMFTYNVNTSNGKLNSVTDAAGNIVFLLRDYSNQVNLIDNTRGQKCRVSMSRSKLLQQITTPDNFNITLDYIRSTGLLKSKRDSNGKSYLYEYDSFGRLVGAITPTGKMIKLSFELNVKGASVVNIAENTGKRATEILIQSGILGSVPTVWRKIGNHIESKTTTLLDGSLISVGSVSKMVRTDAVPYTVLGDNDNDNNKLMTSESYPVPSRQKVEIGNDIMNWFDWKYYLKKQYSTFSSIKSKSSKFTTSTFGADGLIVKKMRINGESILSFEYDRIGSVLTVMFENSGNESTIGHVLFNVSYDEQSRPTRWISWDNLYSDVKIEYHDRYGRLSKWQRGDQVERYDFDQNGKRISHVYFSDDSVLTYTYKDMFSNQPLKVTMPRGSDYLLKYDESGALSSVTTPRGHIHFFNLQISFGFYKYQYYLPTNRFPYEIVFNDDGQVLSKSYPHQSGRIVYLYNDYGNLETVLSGLKSTHYNYFEKLGLIKTIDVLEPSFEQKVEFKYLHETALVKDEQHKYSSKHGLSNVHYKYFYDSNGRLVAIDTDISNHKGSGPALKFKYETNMDILDQIDDIKINRNKWNKTILLKDINRSFIASIQYDTYERPQIVCFNIKSKDVFHQQVSYDKYGRINEQKTSFGRSEITEKFTYDKDGNLHETFTNSGFNYKYIYDENGNVISIIYNDDKLKEKVNIGYDIGDRVIQYSSDSLEQKYSYDTRGFVTVRGDQKYRYNSEGLITHVVEENKFQAWYFYDHLNRMVSWHDDKGNVTQYLYSNPLKKDQVTHLYYPKEKKLLKLHYSDNKQLVVVETADQRYYIACDSNGTPLVLFDVNGNVIKSMQRSPFGYRHYDTNSQLFIPIDFHGGIFDPNTKLVFINKRFYDPLIGQWMSPSWNDFFITKLYLPTELFFYRFQNNDPINGARTNQKNRNYVLENDDWLQMFGLPKKSMIGSLYTNKVLEMSQIKNIEPIIQSDFQVLSGLQCIVNKINENFLETGLFTKWLSSLKPELLNLVPRISYKKSVFGSGVLLSRTENSKVIINVINNEGIIEDVISSVFNNTYFLDLYFNIHNQNTFYFIKENSLKLRDDLDELKRLSGIFNVTTHELNLGDSAKEIRLHGPESVIILKYDVDPEQEKHRILKHALKRAVERAWDLEKQAIAAGFQGRADWSEEEKEELISHGYVDGYEGVDIHNIFRYPQLADDPSNIGFRRDAKRKRRRI